MTCGRVGETVGEEDSFSQRGGEIEEKGSWSVFARSLRKEGRKRQRALGYGVCFREVGTGKA